MIFRIGGFWLAGMALLWGDGADSVMAYVKNPRLNEISGIVRATEAGCYWVHNDSGDGPYVYAIDAGGQVSVVVDLKGVKVRDCEDIARLDARPGRPAEIFLGDIGDNRAERASIAVYRFAEPDLAGQKAGATLGVDAAVLELRYPDGAHDAEALLALPGGDGDPDRLIIITKRHAPNGIYAAELPAKGGGKLVLRKLGDLGVLEKNITGGDVSPSGDAVILRSYQKAYEWAIKDGDLKALESKDFKSYDLPAQPQAEAIVYTPSGQGFATISEGEGQPLYWLRRVFED